MVRGRALQQVRPGLVIKGILQGQIPLTNGHYVAEAPVSDLYAVYARAAKREKLVRPKGERAYRRVMSYDSFKTFFKFACLLEFVEPTQGGAFRITEVGREAWQEWEDLRRAWQLLKRGTARHYNRGLGEPKDWRKKFIVHPGEVPWWKIDDHKKRSTARIRQTQRMRRKKYRDEHPKPKRVTIEETIKGRLLSGELEETLINEGFILWSVLTYARELERVGLRQRPRGPDSRLLYSIGLNAGGQKQCEERRASARLYFRRNVVVYTKPNGKQSYRKDSSKRPRPEDGLCELCGRTPLHYLDYHHWDDSDFSKGLYLCRNRCHTFAEIVDAFPDMAARYLRWKTDLDGLFADPATVALVLEDWTAEWDEIKASFREQSWGRDYARYYKRRYYLGVSISGKLSHYLKLEHKRPHPGGNELLGPCELCGKLSRMLKYHHWDDKDPNKGLWLCGRCHTFAEVVENVPDAEEKYLTIKLRHGVSSSAHIQTKDRVALAP